MFLINQQPLSSQKGRFIFSELHYLSLAILTGSIALLLVVFASLNGLPIELGFNIPVQDTASDYTWAVAITVLFAFLILLPKSLSGERNALLIIWFAKCIIGLYFMLYYEAQYFQLDAYGYFQAGLSDDHIFTDYVFGDGTELISIICSWILNIFPGGYHTLKQIFSFIGLIAIYITYRGFSTLLGKSSPSLLLFLGLFPSLLFWTSVIGKEPIVMLYLGAFIFFSAKMQVRPTLLLFSALVLTIIAAASVRIWLGVILSVPLLWIAFSSPQSFTYRTALIASSFLVISIFAVELADRFDIISQQEAFERLDATARVWSEDGGSGQQIAADISDISSFISFLPIAIFSALYRPLPGEIGSFFGLLSGLENTFLILLTLRALFRCNQKKLLNASIVAGLLFVGCWLILYSTVAYQNLGTAVRFKIQILPTVLVLLLYFGHRSKPKKSLSAIWKRQFELPLRR